MEGGLEGHLGHMDSIIVSLNHGNFYLNYIIIIIFR